MVETTVIFLILGLHFIADFVLQSNEMAENKSTSNKWLGLHCLVYGLCFVLLSPLYALVNGVAHFCIDYVTSRVTKRLWDKGEVHAFFTTIGFDQMLHYTILFLTYIWLL